MKKYVYFLFFLTSECLAQNIHFSQFDKILNRYNPATNAHIDATVRLGLNYRMQWLNLPNKFSTLQLEGAYKIQEGALKSLTTSLYFSNDLITQTGLSNTAASVGFAYPIKFKKHELALGINLGFNYRKIDLSGRSFPSQWEMVTGQFNTASSNHENIANAKKLFFDLGVGISWNSQVKNGVIRAGLGIFHANNPRDEITRNSAHVGQLYNAHLAYQFYLKNQKYSLEPKIRYAYLNKASEMNFGLESQIFFQPSSPEKGKNALIVGVLGRFGFQRTYDALAPLVGYKLQNLTALVSYDFHLGKFSQDFGTSSSLELTLIYTVVSKKNYYFGIPCGIY